MPRPASRVRTLLGAATGALLVVQGLASVLVAAPAAAAGPAASTTTLNRMSPATVTWGTTVSFVAVVASNPAVSAPGGPVQFLDDTTPITACGNVALTPDPAPATTSRATCNTSAANNNLLDVGSRHIKAHYMGDTTYAASDSDILVQTVNKAVPTSALSSSMNPAWPGETVTLKDTFTTTAGAVTGPVAFKDNGVDIPGCAAIQVGVNAPNTADCVITTLGVGTHTISAVYGGDTHFTAATAPDFTQTIGPVPSNTTITSSTSNASVWGQSVTFTATVDPGSHVGTPQGAVDFLDGTTSLCSNVVLNPSAVATCTTAALTVAAHTIKAHYRGDTSNFKASDGTLTQTVDKASTTVAVASNPTSTVSGQKVTFTGTISITAPGAGTPTGTMSFTEGGTDLCPPVTVASNKAACAISTLSTSATAHNVVVTYNGDGNFNPSSPITKTHTVSQASTNTAVLTDKTPSVWGQAVSFSVSVAPNAPGVGTPTGKANYFDGATQICSNIGLDQTCSLSNLSVGSHTITAHYIGDANFAPSDSGPITQTVNKSGTVTAVTSSQNPAEIGAPLTFTATITPSGAGNGTPTGGISFLDGGNPIAGCPASTLSSGSATCTPSPALGKGAHSITASYAGDGNFTASDNTAAPLAQTITPHNTTTALSSAPVSPQPFGTAVTFNAKVAPVTTSAGVPPDGTVSFTDGASPLCSNVAINGTGDAACSAGSALAVGSHTITAAYSGDTAGNFGSSSKQITFVVQKADSTLSLITSKASTSYGEPVTFTATTGPAAVTGSVSFTYGAGTPIQGCSNVAADPTDAHKFVCTTSALPVASPHVITATSSGDTSYNGKTATVNQTVAKATPTFTLASDHSSSVWGQLVTFDVTVKPPYATSAPTGTVTFKDGSTDVCTNVALDGTGHAACQSNNLSPSGSHSISVAYAGDGSYASATSGTISQVVTKASTTTGLTTSNPDGALKSQTITFTATVSPVAPGAGTRTGKVDFKDGTTVVTGCGGVSVAADGTAICTTSTLPNGDRSITAVYLGDSGFNGSTSDPVIQTVGTVGSVTALASSANPAVFGQVVTITATVTKNAPGTPTGTVTFKDGSTTVCPAVTLGADGKATCGPTSFGLGSHSLSAVYSGDNNFRTSTGALTQTVNQANSTAKVASSANPAVSGQPMTFTATVTPTAPGAGSPSGSVTFKDGTTDLCTTVALVSGSATCGPSTAAVGTHSITVVYSGDTNFVGSTSAALSQVVNQAATGTGLSTDGTPTVFGQKVTFTATITPAAPGVGTPTGTVTFKDGATDLCTNKAMSGTSATCATTALGAATHSITAVYNGDTNFASSTSSALSQVVNPAATDTALTGDGTPTVFGQTVTFTAKVSPTAPGAGSPGGTVTFKDGTTDVCTNKAMSGDTATCATSALSVATHSITAVYNGETNFAGSTSAALSQVVNKAATATALASDGTPTVSSQTVTFTATVSPTAPGAGAPTGTVTFKDGATDVCTNAAVTAGKATCATSALGAGSHSMTAVYNGDGSFTTSTSNTVTQVVNKSASSTALASSLNPSASGQSVTFTATVTPTTAGVGTPTGTVTFKDGATALCSTVAMSAGKATCATAGLGAGSHSITAVYNGSGTIAGSTSSALTQTVNAPPAPAPAPARRTGYWMVTENGTVYPFGDAVWRGNALTNSATHLEPTPNGNGYWVVDKTGAVYAFNAPFFGGAAGRLVGDEIVTSLSSTPDGGGYWIFTSKGRAITFGNAVHRDDMAGKPLNAPVIGSVATPTGNGYYMVAADGGVFSFGDARFHGSMGGQHLNAPVMSLVPTADNGGYWLVASDGGIFAFDAPFRGSMGGQPLNAPVTGMVRYGNGYMMVGRDGGIFNFSDKPFAGSLGNNPPSSPVIGVGTLDV